MIKDSSYINNRIKVYENKNEFILSFSCATDITNMLKHNERYNDKYITVPEDMRGVCDDMDISFKKENGDINWQGLTNYIAGSDNYKKAHSSIYRAKNTIYDLMQSNYWDYFVTLTVNPDSEYLKGVDIKNVSEVQKAVVKMIRHINRRSNKKIEYVLIPEYQENGNVHFHGVVSGIDEKHLIVALNNQEFRKDNNGNIIMDKYGNPVKNEYFRKPLIRKGNQVYNHKKFNKIGYNDFEIIRDMSRVGSYCTKYITKDLFERSNEYGAHLYICSQGLERKKEIYNREVDRFKYLTDEEIKNGINEYVYIVRSKYNTKVFINKRYLKDKNKLLKFASEIEVNDVKKSLSVQPGIEKRIDPNFLKALNQRELEEIGIKKYNADTGEIETARTDVKWLYSTALDENGNKYTVKYPIYPFNKKNKDNQSAMYDKYEQLRL